MVAENILKPKPENRKNEVLFQRNKVTTKVVIPFQSYICHHIISPMVKKRPQLGLDCSYHNKYKKELTPIYF